MNKKILMLVTAVAFSTLFLVGCKSDNDDAAPATCTDGIMNGTETGIDCGGTCTACPTCSDGIMNGTETGIDCGGSCGACAIIPSVTATISDGVGGFVADTSITFTNADSSSGSGYVIYKVNARNTSGTLRFDLSVRHFSSAGVIQTNVEYNAGNIGGVVTELKLYQTVGSTPYTFSATSGKIKFSKIDHVNRRVSGTFNFVGSNGAAVTRTITDGTFTDLPLN